MANVLIFTAPRKLAVILDYRSSGTIGFRMRTKIIDGRIIHQSGEDRAGESGHLVADKRGGGEERPGRKLHDTISVHLQAGVSAQWWQV